MSVSVFVTRLGQIVKVVKVSNMVHNENQKGENVRVNVWTIDIKKYGYNMAEGDKKVASPTNAICSMKECFIWACQQSA